MEGVHRFTSVALAAVVEAPEFAHDLPDFFNYLVESLVWTLFAALLAWCVYRRPRASAAVAVLWLTWLIQKFAVGGHALDLVTAHWRHLRNATVAAVGAVAALIAAFISFVLPAVHDAWLGLKPALLAAYQQLGVWWEELTWTDRGIMVIVAMGVYGTVHALIIFRRSIGHIRTRAGQTGRRISDGGKALTEVVRPVLFQLSFLLVGPGVWWLVKQLPNYYAMCVVGFVISWMPTFASLNVFCDLQRARRQREESAAEAAATAKQQRGLSSWMMIPGGPVDVGELPQDLQSRMQTWLSYWGCWPFFSTIYVLLHNYGLVDINESASLDGVLAAVVLWCQFWGASRLAPVMFVFCASIFGRLVQHLGGAIGAAGNRALGLAWDAQTSLMGKAGSHGIALAIAGGLVFVVTAFLLKIFTVAASLITFLALWVVAIDSARAVSKHDMDMCAARLSFWVSVMAWLGLCEVPLADMFLPMWTPFFIILAVLGGEMVLNAMVRAVLSLFSRLCVCLGAGAEKAPAAGQGEQPLLEDEAVTLQTLPNTN